MSHTSPPDPRLELIAAAHFFYHQGWMWGTAGNLSARAYSPTAAPSGSGSGGSREFFITGSGCAKGELTPADFVRVDGEGQVVESWGRKPSAETSIHAAVYRALPQAGACFHVHSVAANVASLATPSPTLRLPPLEMLKGFGIMDENPQVDLPLLANHADVSRIGDDVAALLQTGPQPLPAILIRGHGITTWAPTPLQARHQVELLEFLLQTWVTARQCGVRWD